VLKTNPADVGPLLVENDEVDAKAALLKTNPAEVIPECEGMNDPND
jgi:hypothetical protein